MKQFLQNHWEEILNHVKVEYDITDPSFKTWLKDLKFYDVDENIVTIIVPESILGINGLNFIKNKYGLYIKVSIEEYTNEQYEIKFVYQSQVEELQKKEKEIEENKQIVHKSGDYFDNFTFDNFVVGDNNRIAHDAALAVAEEPGKYYNPLYIYGGVGLGKTHLMHAIRNYIKEHNPELKVMFVTAETFTNDLIESIRMGNNSPNSFREKYRNNDVLLIDDIQFIANKVRTQEEFFHTFNEMRNSGRQIVISSDRPPKEMTTLDERIRSRFEWDLMVDIQPPAYETRMAILKKKANENNYKVEQDILEYIATNVKSSVRTLEGALKRVVIDSKLKHTPITLDSAKEALSVYISPEAKKEINAELVIDVVSEYYNISPSAIFSKNKSKNIAYPRQIAMYICKQVTSLSLSDIGKAMGGRDHTTILHGCNKIEEDRQKDPELDVIINNLIKKINPN
ncbi:MAG: chromosomal replication initiator protein DnaA [Clostridiales bacterium]|nr:chromosomal replication initiator protein DnaA [Clostridiales bacterium]